MGDYHMTKPIKMGAGAESLSECRRSEHSHWPIVHVQVCLPCLPHHLQAGSSQGSRTEASDSLAWLKKICETEEKPPTGILRHHDVHPD